MRRRYFLIDYENVHQAGLAGFSDLTERDTVVIFYSDAKNVVPLSTINNKAKAKLEAYYIEGGDQSLDYQLGSYAGNVIARLGETDCIFIVSMDHDYHKIIHFWNTVKDKEKIFLCHTIQEGLDKYKMGIFGVYPWYIRKILETQKAISSVSGTQFTDLHTRLKQANIGRNHSRRIINHIIMFPENSRKKRSKAFLVTQYGVTEGNRLFNLIEDIL